jgi:hypothetical protein
MPGKKRNSVRPSKPALTEQTIAERAYARWLARGCPTGDGLEDWFAAQNELERESGKSAARPVRNALVH